MVLKRHLGDLDPRATMGVSLALAAVLLTPLAALDPPRATPGSGALASIVVLGLVCTAAAFVLMAHLVAEVGPGRALVITYINPIIAVALGVTILGERPGAGAIAGLLLILAGSWLSTDGRLPPGMIRAYESLARKPARRKYMNSRAQDTSSPPIPKTRKTQSESMWFTSQPKFWPKKPVRKVSGRKIVAMTVSCFMTTFRRLETFER
jgi:hypothetical protein